MTFQALSGPHWIILFLVPVLAALLAWIARSRPPAARLLRFGLGLALMASELHWYYYVYQRGGASFPHGLPLELCDLTLWLTVISLLTLQPLCFELAYYWGLAGSGMALISPDRLPALPSYPAIAFFLAHGGTVAAVLFLVWSGLARPRPGSWRWAFAAMNGYIALIGIFDWGFHTNYGYLCMKPATHSLLDFMGPWPVYVLAADMTALVLFFVLGIFISEV